MTWPQRRAADRLVVDPLLPRHCITQPSQPLCDRLLCLLWRRQRAQILRAVRAGRVEDVHHKGRRARRHGPLRHVQ
eukprot:1934712-Prymnesium_polylepis.1